MTCVKIGSVPNRVSEWTDNGIHDTENHLEIIKPPNFDKTFYQGTYSDSSDYRKEFSKSPYIYNANEPIHIEIKADDGYRFDLDNCKLRAVKFSGNAYQDRTILEEKEYFNNLVLTGNLITLDTTFGACGFESGNWLIETYGNIHTIKQVDNVNIANQLTNCTTNNGLIEINIGAKYEATLTADEHMVFETAPIATVGANTIEAIVSNDKKTATFSFDITNDMIPGIVITGSSDWIYHYVNVDITGVYCNIQAGKYKEGTEFDIIIEPMDDYVLNGLPSILDSNNDIMYFQLIESNFVCHWTLLNDIYIQATARAPKAEKGYGYINIYSVDKSSLAILSNERFISKIITSSPQSVEWIDTSYTILSLKAFFVDIPSSQTDYIRYGSYRSKEAIGNIPDEDILTIDCGSINIAQKYNNSLDYDKYTNLYLFLPFIGEQTIKTNRYMGQTVTLTYKINLVNGDTIAILSSNNGITETFTGNAAFEIPIKYDNVASQNIESNTHYMGSRIPYILVETDVPIENDPDENIPHFGRTTDFYSKLGDLKGYTEADKLELKICDYMLKNDIDTIKAKFFEGVII